MTGKAGLKASSMRPIVTSASRLLLAIRSTTGVRCSGLSSRTLQISTAASASTSAMTVHSATKSMFTITFFIV